MMRSMVLEFTEDRNCAYLASQYMLGDSLLVAPVFRADSIAEYYLPAGRWTSLLTGEVKEGGRWYTEKHGYLSIPLYVREGSIVALGAENDGPVYDYADGVSFLVYELQDKKLAETLVYSADNEKEASAAVTREGGTYEITVESGKPGRVVLVNAGKPQQVSITDYHLDGENLVLPYAGGKKETICVKFDD